MSNFRATIPSQKCVRPAPQPCPTPPPCPAPCPDPCPPPAPDCCPKQQIKPLCIKWGDCQCTRACFQVSKKFAGQHAKIDAVAETFHDGCKDTLVACEKVCIDECGKFCFEIPPFTEALCLTVRIDAPACNCSFNHKKYATLVGLFSSAIDLPKVE